MNIVTFQRRKLFIKHSETFQLMQKTRNADKKPPVEAQVIIKPILIST